MELKVALGSGMKTPPGYVGMDIKPFKGIKYVCDIGKATFPIEDNTVDEFNAQQFMEHLDSDQLIHCFNECFRCIKPTGVFKIGVPVFPSESWLMHPEHKMHWTTHMIAFFLPPNEGIDPHGYLDGFWHAQWQEEYPQLNIQFYPNKEGNPKFPFKAWRRLEDMNPGEIVGPYRKD